MAVAIRERIKENAAAVLAPGEQIQAVMAGQTANPMWGLVSTIIILVKSTYRAIVVTDRRILVCYTGRASQSNIKSVLRELPRSTKIESTGAVWIKSDALGERIYIHSRFRKDIETANGTA